MSDYTTCHLMGGLGNQLFQMFTTIAYGIRYSKKIIFSYTPTLTTGTIRSTYWEDFLQSLKPFTTFNPKHGFTNEMLLEFPHFRENGFEFNDIPYFNNPQVMLYGYYQSYKYFENEKDSIFSLIRLRKQQENIKEEFPVLDTDDIHQISMHFRLGDYKHIQECHPLMPYEYYEKSLDTILQQRNQDKYIVFYFCQLEDNEVVSTIIEKLKSRFTNIDFMKMDDSIEDWKQLLIMSCCNDNIIANSTFSWWGAYFNDKSDKIVCYPTLWFGPRMPNNTVDLFPPSWTKIDI
jgi:hypothetical protein